MQKLFENWREYEKHIIKEYYGPHEAGMTTKGRTSAEDLAKIRQAISIVDPTGVLSWPEVATSLRDLEKDPTYYNSSMFVMSILGAIPVLGKLGKLGKSLGRWIGLIDDAKDLSNTVRVMEDGAEVAQKISKRADDAKEVLETQQKAARAGDVGQAGGRSAAKIAGYSPQVNKAGQKSGVFFDVNERAFVTVKTESGPVTFMYSSGTSLQMVDDTGRVVASPRAWTPVGDYHGGLYLKYAPRGSRSGIPDARFGTGNKEIWDKLLMISDDWDKWMRSRHGGEWAREIWTNPKVTDDVQHMIDNDVFQFIKDMPRYSIGKYPSPNSEFGRIVSELNKLSPDGQANKSLINVFGSPVHGSKEAYNAWRKGELAQKMDESLLKKRSTKILISIKKQTIY